MADEEVRLFGPFFFFLFFLVPLASPALFGCFASQSDFSFRLLNSVSSRELLLCTTMSVSRMWTTLK